MGSVRSTAELRKPTTFRGVPVSTAHRIVLLAAERAGVAFHVNDGRRTVAIQEQRVRDHGLFDPVRNPHGAARPFGGAPHIKWGAAHHALDVDLWRPRAGGQLRLAVFYRARGVPVLFDVASEAWHMDPTSESALVAAARRLDDPFAEYPADERRWLREYDDLVRVRGTRRDTAAKQHRRVVLVREMRARRKSIWRAAQDSGWGRLNRRARYASLLARTK